MSIPAVCSCGHEYTVHERYAGQQRACLYCGKTYLVPGPAARAAPDELALQLEDARIPPDARHAPRAAEVLFPEPVPTWKQPLRRPDWHRRYLFLIVTMLPLVTSSLKHKKEPDLEQQFRESFEALDDSQKGQVQAALERVNGSATPHEILESFPEHKLKGALLPVGTWKHWLYAFVSAALFLAFIVVLLPANSTSARALVLTCLFTGTIGIVLLLVAQWLAFHMPWITRGNIFIVAVVSFLKVIGYAYMLALDSSYGFGLSLLGFIFGVGLCEELCKALPVYNHYTTMGKKMDWRGACVWGLASGVGFGVSEGITYSSDYYNGILSGNIYLIRFVSCVALHAVWAGSAAICIWKQQQAIQAESGWARFFTLVWIVFPLMLMHGLYDTLLKSELNICAMLTALVSFAYFAWIIENAKKTEQELEQGVVVY